MWIIFTFFVIVLYVCTTSDRKRKREIYRRLGEERIRNAVRRDEARKLTVASDEYVMREIMAEADGMARRAGAVIKGWSEVKTDENGMRYIECNMETGDDDRDINRLLIEEGKTFGDSIIDTQVIRKQPQVIKASGDVRVIIEHEEGEKPNVTIDIHNNNHVNVTKEDDTKKED